MSGPLTGEQLFCRINVVMATFNDDSTNVPPAYPTFPSLAPQNLVITNVSGVISLQLTCPTDPSTNTILRGAAPCSAGIERLPRVVVLGSVPAATSGVSDITSLYQARFGYPAVGSRVFVTCNQWINGWESPQVTFTAIVPAE